MGADLCFSADYALLTEHIMRELHAAFVHLCNSNH